jgi:hypothetical protein
MSYLSVLLYRYMSGHLQPSSDRHAPRLIDHLNVIFVRFHVSMDLKLIHVIVLDDAATRYY